MKRNIFLRGVQYFGVLSIAVLTQVEPTRAAERLSSGFFLSVRHEGSECARSLYRVRNSHKTSKQLAHVDFQLNAKSRIFDDVALRREFNETLSAVFPQSQISLDIASGTIRVSIDSSNLNAILDSEIVLAHPLHQMRLVWRPELLDARVSREEPLGPPSEGSSSRKRESYWDVPSDSDPVQGREVWNKDRSDELYTPRGSSRGNRSL